MAQTAAGPDITITAPAKDASYKKGESVLVSFNCLAKPDTTVTECSAKLADGSAAESGKTMLPTGTAGPGSLTVTAKDSAGNASTLTHNYAVVESAGGDVGGHTPATLTLTLGTPRAFPAFVPGVGQDYTTTVSARILSTAGDATLSVADPSSTDTGHMVNGVFSLPAALLIAGTRPPKENQPPATPVFAPVGGSSSPTTLITYDGPVSETDTVTFKQSIGDNDALRTGAYSKTLTFTLSTTNP